MTPPTLDQRTLNRTTLARQGLLERRRAAPAEVVGRLIGLQAQVPTDPYVALYSRIEEFDPYELSNAIEARELVRIVVMRGTIHLLTAADAIALRAHVQPVLDYEMTIHQEHKDQLARIDLGPVLELAEPLLTEQALTPAELRAVMAEHFGETDAAAMAFACRNNLPLVQVPPRGLYGKSGTVRTTTTKGWLGRDAAPATAVGRRKIVERYLAAFGPASVRDVVAWSRVDALGEAMQEMTPKLRHYRNERGADLLDLPDGELVAPDAEAPIRFLPEYDNCLLSHRDRSRFGTDEAKRRLGGAFSVKGTVLIDGTVGAAWHIERAGKGPKAAATLVVEHLDKLKAATRRSIEHEAIGVVRLQAPAASDHDVRVVALTA